MGNTLGGMTFIAGGIVLGYLVLTGRMTKILSGQSTQVNTNTNPNTNSGTPPLINSPTDTYSVTGSAGTYGR